MEEESILEFIVSPAREIGKKVRRYASLCWECWGCSMELKRFKIISIWVVEADHWWCDGVLDNEREEHVV